MIIRMKSLAGDFQGATSAEFALVLPLLVIFLLGIIDLGRLLYTWNEAEKATQMGVRYAVVTGLVAEALKTHSFTVDGLTPGSSVPTTAFKHGECTIGRCQCVTGSLCSSIGNTLGYNDANFKAIVDEMARFLPILKNGSGQTDYSKVQIDYDSADVSGSGSGSGYNLGYVSDPNGLNVAPLVTVKLKNLTFSPFLFKLFGTSITLPDFKTTLTMEDGVGSQSY